MKILAFVDVHGDLKALEKVIEKANSQNPDVIVCAGDLTEFGENLDYFVYMLNKLKKPVLIVPGNHEIPAELKKICSLFDNTIFLHKTSYKNKNCLFIGFSCDGFSATDPEFEKYARQAKKLIKKGMDVVLVTHAPPYGTKVDFVRGSHCGSKSVREFLEKNRIKLNICGHLHETAGKQDLVNKTAVINPGPYGKIINV